MSSTPATALAPDDVAAVQVTLAAEHAATYVLAVVGGRVSASAQPVLDDQVRQAWAAHRDRRDQLLGLVAGAGAEPVAAAVAYAVPPGDLATPAGQGAVAAAVEQACATTYAAQVGSSSAGGLARTLAVAWLSDAARRGLALSGTAEPFPGASDLTPG